jgi:hypothetical protein
VACDRTLIRAGPRLASGQGFAGSATAASSLALDLPMFILKSLG